MSILYLSIIKYHLLIMRLNQSVDKSLILPDQYKHLTTEDQKKIRKLKMAIILLVFVAVMIIIVSIILIITSQPIDSLKDRRNSLQAQNSRLININTDLVNKQKEKANKNTQLTQKQILLINQIDNNSQIIEALQQSIELNCNPTYQRLKFNQTNLNKVMMSVYGASNNRPIFASLNLSNNNLTIFSDNILPDLQVIDISKNALVQISNNLLPKVSSLKYDSLFTLQQFNSNVFPSITSLDLSSNNLYQFNNNTFTMLLTLILDQNSLTQFSNYSFNNLKYLSLRYNRIQQIKGNILPNLQTFFIDSDTTTPNEITNNYLGKIVSLSLKNNGRSFKFNDNYLPQLTELTITESIIQNYTMIASNKIPLLSNLHIRNVKITNYQYLPQLKSLKSLQLNDQSITSIVDHNYPNLQVLFVNSTKLYTFQNNYFPSLANLTLFNSFLNSISNNNVMSNLKYIFLKDNKELYDIQCLRSAKSLQELTLSGHYVDNFQKYDFPLLKKLTIQNGALDIFADNKMPLLNYLKLKSNTQVLSFNQFGNLLRQVQINARIQVYRDYNFESLQTLQIYSVGTSNLQITNNIFSKLYSLRIYNGKSLILSNNTFGRRLDSLSIFYIQTEIQITPDFYGPVYLSILYSKISNFTNQEMFAQGLILTSVGLQMFQNNSLPVADRIDLDQNKLSTIDCKGMPQVRRLDLSGNKLKSQIVDKLINCNLTKLQTLYLQQNSIDAVQKQNLLNKLKQKYPNAVIYI